MRVTESLGPQQVTIPNVVGQSVREASINVRRMSLDLGTLAHIDAPGDPNMVLAQTPPPNAGVDQPRVNLLLSTAGSASDAFVLPSFVGLSYAAASRSAAALGLHLTLVSDAQPNDLITAQSPESGFRITRGDNLRLTLNHPTISTPSTTPKTTAITQP